MTADDTAGTEPATVPAEPDPTATEPFSGHDRITSHLHASQDQAEADPVEASESREEALAAAMAEMDALVGLESVKSRVRELVAKQQVNAVREQAGLPVFNMGLHLVFTGDPGTGKTTVARIMARIYRGLGLLERGHLVETSRVDLVGQYVGHTASLTQQAIDKARGGVLFIDEAYALTGAGDRDFGPEAISTLVKAMEDRRGEFAVIAAGYSDEMDVFVESNPGLRSRFQTFIRFPNYSADELLEIFADLAERTQVTASDEVLAAIRRAIDEAQTDESGGNARYVRSLFEEMTNRLAVRAAADGVVEQAEVVAFDVSDVPPSANAGRGRIGFTG